MNISRKLTASVLALSMALTSAVSLTGCGSDDSSDSKDTAETTTTTAAETEAEPAETEAATEDEPAAEEEEEAEPEERPDFDITQMPGYDESATETVIEIENGTVEAWAAAFPGFITADGASSDDFLDARTFQRDKEMTVTVDFQLTETLQGMLDEGITTLKDTQIVIGPCHANGWTKFGDTTDGIICDYPKALDLDGTEYTLDGENVVDADGNFAPVFVKMDGFIKLGDPAVTSITFTLPAEVVNSMIDQTESEDEESAFDGILFQMGGNCQITKVTIDQGNIYLASQICDAGF